MCVFDDITARLEGTELTAAELSSLKKLLQLFLLGQIVGLSTLNAILVRFGIKSQSKQLNYNKLCKNLTNSNLHKMFEYCFESYLSEVFKNFCKKHPSKWSRELVTAVLDDSVFKQWLQKRDSESAYQNCYGSFFSGQIGRSAYGFQVVTFGVVIEDVFYPLYFESVKKEEVKFDENNKKIPKKGKSTIAVATKLITKWDIFVKKLAKEAVILPKIYFSCDSGYSDVELSDFCLKSGLIYISVPKMHHNICIQNEQTNLKNWIQNVFLPLEEAHKEAEKGLEKHEKTPFYYRFRAFYNCQNKIVTLLAFRLMGSNKVTLVYTSDKNIKAKTLRRHWFQRTYIEQFFKLLKHYMKIQQSITTTKHLFEVKLLRFAFVALHIQLLVKDMKKISHF